MFAFLLRSLRGRLPSLTLTVLGLTFAFAATLAALGLRSVLRTGHPRGTHFAGNPVSIFMHSSAMKLDFFLSPQQVMIFGRALGDSGSVVASAGARSMAITVAGAAQQANVDVVSPNFFAVLGVPLQGGDAHGWADPDRAPGCIVSERFLARLGLVAPPQQVVIAGHQLRVLGIVHGFTGLWDQGTEMWVDWRLGHDVLFPSAKRSGVADQPWFYWTLAIPEAGHQAAFQGKLRRVLARSELAETPFDSFRAMDGITNHVDRRREADTSSTLYLLLCAIMLLVATANLAAWSALMRAGKLASEWTFLRLGMPRRTHVLLGLSFVLLPVLAGSLLALPLERVLSTMLRHDPAIHALLAWSPAYQNTYPWAAWIAIVAGVTTVGWLLGTVVARVAGLRFAASSMRSSPGAVERIFRPLALLVSMVAAMAFLFGATQSANALRTWRALGNAANDQVWMLGVKPGSDTTDASLDRKARATITRAVHARLPQTTALGFATIRPMSGSKQALVGYSLERAGPVALKVMVNQVDPGTLPALGAKLRSGRGFNDDPYAQDLILAKDAAVHLAQIAGRDSVLGMTVYDSSTMAWRIVGIVDRVNYSAALSNAPSVAYMVLGNTPSTLQLLLRGNYTRAQIKSFAKSSVRYNDGSVGFSKPINYGAASDHALARFRSRALLGIFAAAITIAISALTILAIVTLEVRRRRRRLAVRACLGERPLASCWHGVRGPLLSIVLGTLLGMGVMSLARPWLVWQRLAEPTDSYWLMPLCVIVLAALGSAGALGILVREFFAAPLAQHLHEE